METIPQIDSKIIEEHGLSPDEYNKIIKILGREPNYVELGIFSVMWSEHCSYKSSIKMIKTLPRDGGKLLVGAGEENAGLVDLGDGLATAFKIESHNHPSAVGLTEHVHWPLDYERCIYYGCKTNSIYEFFAIWRLR